MAETEDIEVKIELEPDEFFKKSVTKTYNYLMNSVPLASRVPELLFIQSMQGRAMHGHWTKEILSHLTENRIYPNTTIEDVIVALDMDVYDIQSQRQAIIDDISTYIDRAFDHVQSRRFGSVATRPANKLQNQNREPLGGIKLFDGTLIEDPLNVLVGAYLGGCLDCAEWRSKTEDAFGIKMHKGISRAVNMQALRENGLTLNILASLGTESFPDMVEGGDWTLEKLGRRGILSNNEYESYRNGFVNGYVELQKGFGVSDDAAFLAVCLEYGIEAGFGFLIMDAVDTWDKSTPRIRRDGYDEQIGQGVKRRFEKLFGNSSFPVTDDDVKNIIYLAATNKENYNVYPSCSQRRFVQIDANHDLCPIESHVMWVRHVKHGTAPPASTNIAFKQVPSHLFYDAFKVKYQQLAEMDRLNNPLNLPMNGKH